MKKTRDKTMEELQQDVISIFKKYEMTGTNRWTYQTAVLDLQYQIGSLTKCIMQLRGDRFSDGKTATQLRATIGDELADILAEVLFIAHELGLDMAVGWDEMSRSDNRKISDRTTTKVLNRRQAS